jgi:Trypsin-co-occurring domain 1
MNNWRKYMPAYVEYDLGDGAKLLVETVVEEEGKVVQAARANGDVPVSKAQKTFLEAFQTVTQQARMLLVEMDSLKVSEAEIKFGINAVGELGNLAIGKMGMGVNYEITLKWKMPEKVK